MVKKNNTKIPQWLPMLQMLGDMKSSIINPLLFQFYYWGQNDWNRMWESRNAMASMWTVRLYSHEFPAGGRGVSALQAVGKASHCRRASPAPQIHRQGDRKRRAESVWWKKGTVRKQRRERSRLGEWFPRSIGQMVGWEELKNPIT